MTRDLVRGILERGGFSVHEAVTGGQALTLASTLRPDLIILDIELPDIGGLEVARRLKERDPTARIPVLHLSGTRVGADDMVRGLDAGADAYLVHPVEPQVLLSTIRALLRMRNTVGRIASLQALTASLSSASSAEQIADALIDDGLNAAGATGIALATAGGGANSLELIKASPGWPAPLSGTLERASMVLSAPLSICAWVGEPLWIPSYASLTTDYPHLASASAALMNVEAVACLPLSFGEQICGAIGFVFPILSPFSEVNRSFLLTIATECGHAFERIYLSAAERRARAEAERAAAQERAARLEQERVEAALRMSIRAREDLLAIVSHDLRNPLSAVIMSTSLIKTRLLAGKLERADEYLDRTFRAAERMRVLIDDLLDAASIESGRFIINRAPHPIGGIVTDVVEMLGPMAKERSIELHADVPGSPVVDCDRKRVMQVLSNLVGNAIKFTPAKGSILICASEEDAHIKVTVSDTGPGISKDQVPHLFDRYWKGPSRDGGGAGLGLYIVKGIVEAHGGSVSVESSPGEGTSFSFSLPHHPLPPPQKP